MHNLPKNWLNSGGNMYVSEKMQQTAVLGMDMTNLKVYFLDWKSMIVLKILASREQPDKTDAIALIRKYNVKDEEEVVKWCKELQPHWVHFATPWLVKVMLWEAWEAEETNYVKLRTLLDTYGYRDKTVYYYAGQILGHAVEEDDQDQLGKALEKFGDWLDEQDLAREFPLFAR